jgi:hypothetical protein
MILSQAYIVAGRKIYLFDADCFYLLVKEYVLLQARPVRSGAF